MLAKRVTLLAAFFVVASAGAGAAQLRPHVGPRFGVDTKAEDIFIGFHMTAPIDRRIEFYPSINLFLPDRGSSIGFSGDFKVLFPTRANTEFYTGAGLNVHHVSFNGVSDTNLGANLIGGIETRLGRVHPFVESRLVFNRETAFQGIIGLNFTFGRHY
ncbi:MAG: hypothetical protein HOP28_18490 [Gemmatimonadales bacterium]|nr:hypothetical protein [Gemmatimonadales bacterium]